MPAFRWKSQINPADLNFSLFSFRIVCLFGFSVGIHPFLPPFFFCPELIYHGSSTSIFCFIVFHFPGQQFHVFLLFYSRIIHLFLLVVFLLFSLYTGEKTVSYRCPTAVICKIQNSCTAQRFALYLTRSCTSLFYSWFEKLATAFNLPLLDLEHVLASCLTCRFNLGKANGCIWQDESEWKSLLLNALVQTDGIVCARILQLAPEEEIVSFLLGKKKIVFFLRKRKRIVFPKSY